MTATDAPDIEGKTRKPRGELSIRVLAMPADTNQNGDIFGGWLLGQMDIAGSIFSYKIAQGRTVTVSVEAMTFRKPVYVGDVVCIYAELIRIGRTSIAVRIEAWVNRRNERQMIQVTEGTFTYVAVGDDLRPKPVHAKSGIVTLSGVRRKSSTP